MLADVKTFAAHGVYAEACPTLQTVQSTMGVMRAEVCDPAWVAETLACLVADNSFDVIKIGALGDAAVARVVGQFLEQHPAVPVVLDPVMVSSSGASLLDDAGREFLREKLLPLATWVTPNLAELAILTGRSVLTTEEVENATQMVQLTKLKIILFVTGGHLKQPHDYLILPGETEGRWVEGNRVESRATHGTGCTLSSAIAARLAKYPEEGPERTVVEAKRYVEGAIRGAAAIGRGAGPMNHFWQR